MILINARGILGFFFFFFFKQKTAYEMLRSLVGSEMCIRDRVSTQSTGLELEAMASPLTLQRGRIADFLVANNYHLTALEFHQELLAEGTVSDVPKLVQWLQTLDKECTTEKSIEEDELDSNGAKHLDQLVLHYLKQRGYATSAMLLEERVQPQDEPEDPDEKRPSLMPLYQFAMQVFRETYAEEAAEPEDECGQLLEQQQEGEGAADPEGEEAADAEDPVPDSEEVPKTVEDKRYLRKLEAENESLRSQLRELQQPGIRGDAPAISASSLDSGVELQQLVGLLSDQLPHIVPNVLISKREPLIPILLNCVGLHEEHKKRDELTSILFNLIKRPDDAQRNLILNGYVSLAKKTDTSRIETELIPQLWEELSHKHPERRALVVQAVGTLAPFVKPHLRGSLLVSMIRQMSEEEREQEVRLLIADNLGILIGYLFEIDDTDKMRDVFELVLCFAKDPDPEVGERLNGVLISQMCKWAETHGVLSSNLLSILLKAVDKAGLAYAERGDSSNLCRLLELFTKCIEPLHREILSTAPWAEPGQELDQLQARFDEFIVGGDDTQWAAWEWTFERCTPQFMGMAPTRGVATPATREVGFWLATVFQRLGHTMGAPYVRDVLRPQFSVMMDQAHDPGCSLVATNRGRLFPLYIAGVLTVLGENELEEAIVQAYEDGALNQNGWTGDCVPVLLEATHDLCRFDHTALILNILSDMLGNLAEAVRVLVSQVLGGVLPFTSNQLMHSRLMPAVLTLVNDQNINVKRQAIHTLALLAERIPDDDQTGIERMTSQFEVLLSEGSRGIAIEIMSVFASILVCPHPTPLRTFIPVSYTHLRAHETPEHLVCRLLLEKKKKKKTKNSTCVDEYHINRIRIKLIKL
eukprot:TRINITY_DN59919_c0_g1_i2.p1 TRINITY_DN59919_c0_g1~~TRINITY_DN59919_c0_g1_i2.p1  ORF type:complete len:869 (+),score=257.20 TRINITY_DN59919_c0_g1_i2:79-2685(+)